VTRAFRERVLAGETLVGAFLGLGSPLTAEILALAGFDWLVIDLEHGLGTEREALAQLQALSGSDTPGIVRVESCERPRFLRALDMGAVGVLVPQLEDLAEVRRAVSYSRYAAMRGLAKGNRAWEWGRRGSDYLERADQEVVVCVMIETTSALESVHEIASVDGVDVLFLGPTDMARALGISAGPDASLILDAGGRVAAAARAAGKAAGVIVSEPHQCTPYRHLGFTVLGCGTDAAILSREASRLVDELRPLKPQGR
jgi:4-hydroxy-2-oxoheptanedioate aldolase